MSARSGLSNQDANPRDGQAGEGMPVPAPTHLGGKMGGKLLIFLFTTWVVFTLVRSLKRDGQW